MEQAEDGTFEMNIFRNYDRYLGSLTYGSILSHLLRRINQLVKNQIFQYSLSLKAKVYHKTMNLMGDGIRKHPLYLIH